MELMAFLTSGSNDHLSRHWNDRSSSQNSTSSVLHNFFAFFRSSLSGFVTPAGKESIKELYSSIRSRRFEERFLILASFPPAFLVPQSQKVTGTGVIPCSPELLRASVSALHLYHTSKISLFLIRNSRKMYRSQASR